MTNSQGQTPVQSTATYDFGPPPAPPTRTSRSKSLLIGLTVAALLAVGAGAGYVAGRSDSPAPAGTAGAPAACQDAIAAASLLVGNYEILLRVSIKATDPVKYGTNYDELTAEAQKYRDEISHQLDRFNAASPNCGAQ